MSIWDAGPCRSRSWITSKGSRRETVLCAVCAYGSIWTGKTKPGGLPSDLFGGANPPDERKEGDANECYILGFDPVADFHCCPDRSVLSDLQGKEIAATTLNSDGLNN